MASCPSTAIPPGEIGGALMNLEDNLEDDGLDPVPIAENNCTDALAALMNKVEPPLVELESIHLCGDNKIAPTIEYSGKVLYKLTLVSQLNGNLYLSKDQLTRI
jgi:hypothetical protein